MLHQRVCIIQFLKILHLNIVRITNKVIKMELNKLQNMELRRERKIERKAEGGGTPKARRKENQR
jgi:hypothetical protein